MIKVNANGEALSSDYYNKINSASRHFALRLTNVESGEDLDLTYKKASFHRGSCGSLAFAIGCAYSAYIEVTAVYSDILLEGTKVLACIGLLMNDDSYEWVKIGTFMIQKPQRENDLMTFTAVDAMLYAIVGEYTSTITYPATIDQVIEELEQMYSIDIVLNAPIGSCQIYSPIAVTNARSVIQALASLALGYAYVNSENKIVIDYFGRHGDVVTVDYDLVKTQPTTDEEETVFSGIKVQVTTVNSAETQNAFVYPDNGENVHYATVGCPYMTQEIFDTMKVLFTGFSYHGGEIRFMGNPLIEPSDILVYSPYSDDDPHWLVTDTGDDIVIDQTITLDAETEDGDKTVVDERPAEIIVDGAPSIEAYMALNVACMQIDFEFDGGLTTVVTCPGSFEETDSSTQPGVLSQLVALEQQTGQTTAQLISNARSNANAAKTIADNTNQYFWHTTTDDGSGVGTGAHITEIPQKEFVRDPENGGANLLARSNGLAVRNGLVEMAQFSATGICVYQDGFPVFVADSGGAEEETAYLYDLTLSPQSSETIMFYTPADKARVKEFTIGDTLGDEEIEWQTLEYGVPQSGNLIYCGYSYDGVNNVTFSNNSEGDVIVHLDVYGTFYTPFFTLGSRQGSKPPYSTTIGRNLMAASTDQTVIGHFNEEDADGEYAFIIGNGVYERSNALAVDWNGNVITGGMAQNAIYAAGDGTNDYTLASGSRATTMIYVTIPHTNIDVVSAIIDGVPDADYVRANVKSIEVNAQRNLARVEISYYNEGASTVIGAFHVTVLYRMANN